MFLHFDGRLRRRVGSLSLTWLFSLSRTKCLAMLSSSARANRSGGSGGGGEKIWEDGSSVFGRQQAERASGGFRFQRALHCASCGAGSCACLVFSAVCRRWRRLAKRGSRSDFFCGKQLCFSLKNGSGALSKLEKVSFGGSVESRLLGERSDESENPRLLKQRTIIVFLLKGPASS